MIKKLLFSAAIISTSFFAYGYDINYEGRFGLWEVSKTYSDNTKIKFLYACDKDSDSLQPLRSWSIDLGFTIDLERDLYSLRAGNRSMCSHSTYSNIPVWRCFLENDFQGLLYGNNIEELILQYGTIRLNKAPLDRSRLIEGEGDEPTEMFKYWNVRWLKPALEELNNECRSRQNSFGSWFN